MPRQPTEDHHYQVYLEKLKEMNLSGVPLEKVQEMCRQDATLRSKYTKAWTEMMEGKIADAKRGGGGGRRRIKSKKRKHTKKRKSKKKKTRRRRTRR